MQELLANVYRGPIVESTHYGHVAVADKHGKLLAYAGNPNRVTFMRSAAKPVQAVNVLLSGADKTFHFTSKELAIMCASHYGEDFHRDVIFSMLSKMNLTQDALLCGSPYSISDAYHATQLLENRIPQPFNSDCSGKHCGFLSVCKVKGYPLDSYNTPEHPMQKEILSLLSTFAGADPQTVPIGCDGCSVPVHGFSIAQMATLYARFADPSEMPKQYIEPCEILFQAMNDHPEMIAGTDGFCTALIKHTNGRLVGKMGAEAIYCVGIKEKGLGIAVKIEDGSLRAVPPVVLSVLDQLDLLSDTEKEALSSFLRPPVKNVPGEKIGEIAPAVELHYVN